MSWTLILIAWIAIGITSTVIADKKKMGAGMGFVCGFFLGILGLVIVLLNPDKPVNNLPVTTNGENEKSPIQLDTDAAGELLKWHELKEKGAITNEEYERKKQVIFNK